MNNNIITKLQTALKYLPSKSLVPFLNSVLTEMRDANRLAEAGSYMEACELLFGKAVPKQEAAPVQAVNVQPGFELVEGDGRERRLEEAEAYWKSQGCEIARLSHYYAMADFLTQEQLESIRRDRHARWVVTDRLGYRGRMVSVNGGEPVECPEYEGVLLAEVLGTPAGLNLVQALCGTKDGADAIMRKLEKLLGVGRGAIWVWTPSMNSRKARPSRAAGFNYYNGVFHVSGDDNLGYDGRSRGVRRREAR